MSDSPVRSSTSENFGALHMLHVCRLAQLTFAHLLHCQSSALFRGCENCFIFLAPIWFSIFIRKFTWKDLLIFPLPPFQFPFQVSYDLHCPWVAPFRIDYIVCVEQNSNCDSFTHQSKCHHHIEPQKNWINIFPTNKNKNSITFLLHCSSNCIDGDWRKLETNFNCLFSI